MDPLEYNSNNYKQQVIDWAVRNPGALWQDTKEASAVRSWMEQNAPDDFASLYWNEDDTSKIDSRFIPMKARERRMEDAVRSRDKAVPYIAGALAAPVIAGEAISAIPYISTGLDLLSTSKFGRGITHGLNVLGNPVAAKTTAGSIGALGLDVSGLFAGLKGLSQDITNIRNGNYSWNQVPQTLLNGTVMLPGSSVLTRPQNWSAAFNNSRGLYNNFRNTINQFKDLKIDLDVTNLPLESTKPFPFTISDLPGYQLGILMRGNPLEKQISKTGTISVNSIQALANKGSNVEKSVINKVLSEKFAGQKNINYNQFRKAVQDELITYDVAPDAFQRYADYGMERLGFKVESDPGSYELPGIVEGANPEVHLFFTDRIPIGNDKHYADNTLGHIRTYTDETLPGRRFVLESQSDWGQHPINKGYVDAEGARYDTIEDFEEYVNYLSKEVDSGLSRFFPNARRVLDENINLLKAYKESSPQISPQEQYLHDNYLQRQLQEALKLSAQKGERYLLYPTPETAAKIERFNKFKRIPDELMESYHEMEALYDLELNKLIKQYLPKGYLDPGYRINDMEDDFLSTLSNNELLDLHRRSDMSAQFDASIESKQLLEKERILH